MEIYFDFVKDKKRLKFYDLTIFTSATHNTGNKIIESPPQHNDQRGILTMAEQSQIKFISHLL